MIFSNLNNINVEFNIISYETGGKVEKNDVLMKNIPKTDLNETIIKKASKGTTLIKLGKKGPKLMITAGIHGDELPPQIASLNIINKVLNCNLRGTLYVIPFVIPYATMENSRRFNGIDMNRTAAKAGYLSNNLLKIIKMLKIDAVADFHSTKLRSNPGRQSVFCSKKPCIKSFKIAQHISENTPSELIFYKNAGLYYKGAFEDECNLAGIPAVTCEVVSENGVVDPGSPKKSYNQMMSFLNYFNMIR
ncbi:MAG: succinylglutamate desuccinylase/aspartoacylase family protein [Methanobacteriaceae archaeon]|nr:succinylglutamate desuccinylase/aspartoacylase family protein [Methanobacteriaceae archaeon]